jgi:diguanylate cyclase (GGDEF)-like protein
MRFDRGLARQLAPFGAAAVLGFAVVLIQNRVDWAGYALAGVVTALSGWLIVAGPSLGLSRRLRIVPALLFLAAVALLRDAGGGTVAGVGALALLPVFWVALHGSRAELLAIIGSVCAFFTAPTLLGGGAEYQLGNWRLGATFAAAAAIVGFTVQNLVARVREQARALAVRERDLEAMADLSRTISGARDARDRICVAACDLSGADFAELLEGRSEDALTRTAFAGSVASAERLALRRDAAWATAAYSSGTAVFVGAREGRTNAVAALDGPDAPAALLFEPVRRGETAVGVLVVGWHERPVDERRTAGLVRLLASEAAFAIERADLVGRLTEIALTDTLTGLPNRRAWDDRLAQAVRDHEPICVAILDLDRFKTFNDLHGHQAGDRLLKEAAAAWRAQLRSTDMLARYGGEEFVVLLHGHDLDAARRVVERLRRATPREQSCSAGLACREGGEDAAALLARADAALYEAKRAGRDRSVTARPAR